MKSPIVQAINAQMKEDRKYGACIEEASFACPCDLDEVSDILTDKELEQVVAICGVANELADMIDNIVVAARRRREKELAAETAE